MPWATATVAATTGDAASAVAALADRSVVAIASERAARLNRLVVVADDVGDHPEAYTRFVSVASYTRLDRRPGAWRTAFSFVTDHRPGSLLRAIEPLARRSIDLAQLVSRPIPQSPGATGSTRCSPAIRSTTTSRPRCESCNRRQRVLRVFGSYRADLRGPGRDDGGGVGGSRRASCVRAEL